jgi:hypothetical protein
MLLRPDQQAAAADPIRRDRYDPDLPTQAIEQAG